MNRALIRAAVACTPLVVAAAASVSRGTEISISFEGNLTTNTANEALSGTTVAGAPGVTVAGSTWNNAAAYYGNKSYAFGDGNSFTTGANGTYGNIYVGTTGSTATDYFYDSNSQQTNLLVSITNGSAYNNSTAPASSPANGDTGQDDIMFDSAVSESGTGGGAAKVALSNIPYTSTGYSVYVYFTSGAGGTTHQAYVTDGPTGTDTTYYFYDTEATAGPFPGWQAASDTNPADASIATAAQDGADYAVFTGETASTLTLTLSAYYSTGVDFAGIQIVQNTPEPATLGLLGAIGGAMLLRRRHPLERA